MELRTTTIPRYMHAALRLHFICKVLLQCLLPPHTQYADIIMLFVVTTIHFQPAKVIVIELLKFGSNHLTCIEGGVDCAETL